MNWLYTLLFLAIFITLAETYYIKPMLFFFSLAVSSQKSFNLGFKYVEVSKHSKEGLHSYFGSSQLDLAFLNVPINGKPGYWS